MMRIYFTAPWQTSEPLFTQVHRQRADGDEKQEAGVETWALVVRFHALLPTADARWVGLEDIRAGDVDGEERRN